MLIKIFRTIWKTLYFLITMKERRMYQHAKYRRREVLDVKSDAFGSTYYMGRYLKDGKEPERDYITWKEFRKIHKF